MLPGNNRGSELREAVAAILDSARDGVLTNTKETQAIDFKEEAGRRRGGELLPGKPENVEAANALADEVACMANSPGGGALIVGVEDKSGRILGTELDVDWLRQGINSRVGVAPDIVAYDIDGQRIVVIFVAEAREPVADTGNRLRWRVGDSCKPVDRSQWWEHRERSRDFDTMAQASTLGLGDVRAAALDICRGWAGEMGQRRTDEEFLRAIGALRSDNKLSVAAALLLTPVGRVGVELTQFSVPSGAVLNRIEPSPEASLVEQIDAIERALSVMNTKITVVQGLAHRQIHRVPPTAVREAMLNGLIHRDWNRSTPTELRWTEADSTFEVRSPGGFVGGVNAGNILSQREARYPALADLFRAIGLVDKQGVGVDRMYRAMISLGHRPPVIEEVPGAYVETTLVGGAPHTPVLELMEAMRPAERRDDHRLSILLYELLHHPFVTESQLAKALQSSDSSSRAALEAALQTVVKGQPIVAKYQDVWVLGEGCLDIVGAHDGDDSVYQLVPYRSTDEFPARTTVERWLGCHSSVTTGDFMALTGVSRGTAKKILDGLVDSGYLAARGQGRSSRYVASTDARKS